MRKRNTPLQNSRTVRAKRNNQDQSENDDSDTSCSSNKTCLFDLPIELIRAALSFLGDVADIARCSSVSTSWARAASASMSESLEITLDCFNGKEKLNFAASRCFDNVKSLTILYEHYDHDPDEFGFNGRPIQPLGKINILTSHLGNLIERHVSNLKHFKFVGAPAPPMYDIEPAAFEPLRHAQHLESLDIEAWFPDAGGYNFLTKYRDILRNKVYLKKLRLDLGCSESRTLPQTYLICKGLKRRTRVREYDEAFGFIRDRILTDLVVIDDQL
uniref:F-box domain-containing protein n=1 Tax=Leptocylindrus danicus TaxID=163516 RepID=A0A7S2P5E5_9STRA